jgi:hypothetical protein
MNKARTTFTIIQQDEIVDAGCAFLLGLLSVIRDAHSTHWMATYPSGDGPIAKQTSSGVPCASLDAWSNAHSLMSLFSTDPLFGICRLFEFGFASAACRHDKSTSASAVWC